VAAAGILVRLSASGNGVVAAFEGATVGADEHEAGVAWCATAELRDPAHLARVGEERKK